MTTSIPVARTQTDVSAAIVLLLTAEATLFFTYLFIIGPIPTPALLLPFAAVLGLCAALCWGQQWARWALLAPIALRVWKLVLLTSAAWGLGRTGTALFVTLIILGELVAAFILINGHLRSFVRQRLSVPG